MSIWKNNSIVMKKIRFIFFLFFFMKHVHGLWSVVCRMCADSTVTALHSWIYSDNIINGDGKKYKFSCQSDSANAFGWKLVKGGRMTEQNIIFWSLNVRKLKISQMKQSNTSLLTDRKIKENGFGCVPQDLPEIMKYLNVIKYVFLTY